MMAWMSRELWPKHSPRARLLFLPQPQPVVAQGQALVRSSILSSYAWIATVTRSSLWSINVVSHAIPDAGIASTALSRGGKLVDIADPLNLPCSALRA